MDACQRRGCKSQIVKLAPIVFLIAVVMGCSQTPTALSEEELLKVLVKVNHVGPLNFRRDVWPSLEKKTITYCGQLQEINTRDAHTLLLVKIDKLSGGEKLPWSLEGKSASPDVASAYKPGEPLCMTGIIEGFSQVRENVYHGYVKILSLTKSAES